MKLPKPTSVDAYIASQPEAVQTTLHRIRAAIRKAVPTADEVISYNIPGFKLHGKPVLYFGAWKTFISLYPVNSRVVAAFPTELAPYQQSKGTVRFPLSEAIPVKLIAAIARFRADEVTGQTTSPPPPNESTTRPRRGSPVAKSGSRRSVPTGTRPRQPHRSSSSKAL